MAIWEKANLASQVIGARVSINPAGAAWVRILAPSFRRTDGSGDYANVGCGCQIYIPPS